MTIYKKHQTVNKRWHYIFCFFICAVLTTPLIINHAFVNEYTRPKQYYFFFAMGALLIIAAVHNIMDKKRLAIAWRMPDVFILCFYCYCIIRILLCNGMGMLIHDIEFLKLTGLVFFYFILKSFFASVQQSFNGNYFLFILLFFMVLGIYESVLGLSQYLKGHDALQMHGTFDNTGPYTNYICTLFPIALGYILLNTGKKAKPLLILSFIFLCGIMIIIPLSKARTAWIAVIASSLMILWFRYQNHIKQLFNTRIKKVVIVFVTLLCIGAGSYFLFNMKKDSALGRLFVWKITMQMIADKPLTGHGLDAYYPVKNKYQATYFAGDRGTEKEKMVAGNIRFAFNDYLQIAASTGIIGLILFLLFIGTSIFPFSNDKNNPYLVIFKTGIVALLLMSLFSYPMQRLSTQLNFFFFIAIINALGHKRVKTVNINNRVKTALAIVMIILPVLFIKMQWKKYQANLQWKKIAIKAQTGQREMVFGEYNKLLPVLAHNPFFLFNYGAELSVAGHYKEGLKILSKAKPMIYDADVFIYTGNCYLGLQQYKQAEEAYMEAIHLKPYLFIPRYQLVHLYFHSGDNEQAVQMAKEIIALEPKVNTNMIRKIKKEMYEFLENF